MSININLPKVHFTYADTCQISIKNKIVINNVFLLFYNFGHWGEIAKNLRLILNEYFRPNAAKLAENNLAKPILAQIFLPFLH